MSSYLTSLIAISALVGISSYLSFSESNEGYVKVASSFLVISVTLTPLIALIKEADNFKADEYTLEEFLPDIEDSEYGKGVKAAFEEGTQKFVCERFSLSLSDVRVAALGFDPLTVRAEKIKVILYGGAACADLRAIAYEISSAGLGECEVEIGVR